MRENLKSEIGQMMMWAGNLRTAAEREYGLMMRRLAITAFEEGRYDAAQAIVNILRAAFIMAQDAE
jgi:hypothetical protein